MDNVKKHNTIITTEGSNHGDTHNSRKLLRGTLLLRAIIKAGNVSGITIEI